jgi:adenosine kinase
MTQSKLVISGSIATDRLMSFSGSFSDMIKPDKIDILSVSILMEKLKIVRGGVGANIAYNAGQLGMNPILLGSVGPDGKDYLAELEVKGVDISYVHISDLPTAAFTAFTDGNSNQVGGFYPGAMMDSATQTLDTWANTDTVICVSANDPSAMRMQVNGCRQYGLTLIYDPGQQVNNMPGEDIAAGWDAASVMLLNEYELGIVATKTGKSTDELKQGCDIFITTLGAKGATLEGKLFPEPVQVKPPTIDEVLDPTGAGDGFRAGFLYGYIRQWDPEDSVRLGSVMGSFVVESDTPQPTITKEMIQNRFTKEYNKEISL